LVAKSISVNDAVIAAPVRNQAITDGRAPSLPSPHRWGWVEVEAARFLTRATFWVGHFLAAAALISPVALGGENWPEFRGPSGDGHCDGAALPIRWSETENVRWKTSIHDKGWSSPVIWENQIWLTTATNDGKKLFVICVNRETGKILFDIKLFEVAKPGFCPAVNSYASPTPVVEAGRVYVHFGSYGTACLDTATGRTIWSRRDLPCDHHRAPGSSPILYGDLLFIHFDGVDIQYVVALDKATGQTKWKRDREIDYGTTDGDLKKAFGTPAVIKVNGAAQLVSPSAVATIAYDPATGRELWKVYHGGMNVAARPVFDQGMVFVTTGETAPFQLLSIRPDGHGDVTKSHVVWKQNRGVPARPSLLLVGDLLYMVNDSGVATCMESHNGQVVWQKRLGGTHFASPIYANGRIYFFDDEGIGYVLEKGREMRVLARNRLDDGCMASPAAAASSLFIRTKTHLYRIEEAKKEEPAKRRMGETGTRAVKCGLVAVSPFRPIAVSLVGGVTDAFD
jgi:outer membrane protein assembly factor BamB